jgi:hypothetical protein
METTNSYRICEANNREELILKSEKLDKALLVNTLKKDWVDGAWWLVAD